MREDRVSRVALGLGRGERHLASLALSAQIPQASVVQSPRAVGERTLERGLGAAHRELAREVGGSDAAHGDGSHRC